MKIKYILNGLDCANCVAKMENEISKLKGINNVSISFMTTKMVLELVEENFEETLINVEKIVKKIEPDVELKRI